MVRIRKVVYHMKVNHFIAPLYQNLKVPGKSGRLTGNINQAFRFVL